MNETQKKNYETAKKLIHKIAAEENIESQFLLSAPDLKQVILKPEFLNEKIVGWRYQLFGSQIQDLQQN